MKKYERHLTKRDRKIVDFVARYRIGTAAMFRQLYFPPGDHPENVSRVLRRLDRRGLVRQVEYGKSFHYFVITRRGLRTLGLPPRTPRPLTEQSLPVLLAIATYCAEENLRRLRNSEFRELYPELWRTGLGASSYVLVDTPDGLKLAMLIVDRGGAARRVRGRIRRIISQRSGLPDFVSLMEAGRFRVVVLTGLPEQQAKIDRQIERESFGPVEVVSALVSDLGEILTLRR